MNDKLKSQPKSSNWGGRALRLLIVLTLLLALLPMASGLFAGSLAGPDTLARSTASSSTGGELLALVDFPPTPQVNWNS